MPRFAANLSMMYTEVDFLDRFAAATGAEYVSGVKCHIGSDAQNDVGHRCAVRSAGRAVVGQRLLIMRHEHGTFDSHSSSVFFRNECSINTRIHHGDADARPGRSRIAQQPVGMNKGQQMLKEITHRKDALPL